MTEELNQTENAADTSSDASAPAAQVVDGAAPAPAAITDAGDQSEADTNGQIDPGAMTNEQAAPPPAAAIEESDEVEEARVLPTLDELLVRYENDDVIPVLVGAIKAIDARLTALEARARHFL